MGGGAIGLKPLLPLGGPLGGGPPVIWVVVGGIVVLN